MRTKFLTLLLLMIISCSDKIPNGLSRQPVVGIVQDNQAPILVKTISEGKVRIEYKKADDEKRVFTKWTALSEQDAFTASLYLKDLKEDSEYEYRIEFESGDYSKWYHFKTFPMQGEPGKFSFVFSACLREKYMGYDIFAEIEKVNPDFVALLGDQMYGDYDGNLNKLESYLSDDYAKKELTDAGETVLNDKSVLEAFRNKYSRVFKENYQKMASHIPVMATWDDHDFGEDNSDGTYPYKKDALKVFNENYPAYPYEDENGGIYYNFSIANVDVFVLDTRWYRTPMQSEDGEEKSMLGPVQLEWLLNGLKNSGSPFKIVFSSTSLNDYGGDTSSKRKGFDSWMGYKYERNILLSFIEENNIQGVLVFSGDQHYPSAHILNWKKPLKSVSKSDKSAQYKIADLGPAVFDFSASPLSYKKAAGHAFNPEYQNNTDFSYEIYRPEWAHPKKKVEGAPIVIGSVYGVAEINTAVSPATVSVKFYELNEATSSMEEIYHIAINR